MGASNPDGSCKTTDDWTTAFNAMKNLPGGFDSVRLYASSDCGTLANAVPAAVATGIQILVGIWTEDWDHYNTEKGALIEAINEHGTDWIVAVSVGSEDLYRNETDPATLAYQIYDVQGMLSGMGYDSIQVGHTDTYNAWTNCKKSQKPRFPIVMYSRWNLYSLQHRRHSSLRLHLDRQLPIL